MIYADLITLAYEAGRRAGKRAMQEPDEKRLAGTSSTVATWCRWFATMCRKSRGCLPRASYVPEDGMGYICKCDAVCCPQSPVGSALKKFAPCVARDHDGAIAIPARAQTNAV